MEANNHPPLLLAIVYYSITVADIVLLVRTPYPISLPNTTVRNIPLSSYDKPYTSIPECSFLPLYLGQVYYSHTYSYVVLGATSPN